MSCGSLARELLDFFLPAACLGCGDHLPVERRSELVCLECRAWGVELTGARSAVVLRSPADDLVHGLKYGGWAELAGFMGRRMARCAIPPPLSSGPYLVVPVPTTR